MSIFFCSVSSECLSEMKLWPAKKLLIIFSRHPESLHECCCCCCKDRDRDGRANRDGWLKQIQFCKICSAQTGTVLNGSFAAAGGAWMWHLVLNDVLSLAFSPFFSYFVQKKFVGLLKLHLSLQKIYVLAIFRANIGRKFAPKAANKTQPSVH